MGRNMFVVVSDDQNVIHEARFYAQQKGMEFKSYSTMEWEAREGDSDVPSLATGVGTSNEGAKILQFPGNHGPSSEQKVKTINELESIAIENAIMEYNGNLTEAAKALGIGRATLYRKVKQYNIDPSYARKKRAA